MLVSDRNKEIRAQLGLQVAFNLSLYHDSFQNNSVILSDIRVTSCSLGAQKHIHRVVIEFRTLGFAESQ